MEWTLYPISEFARFHTKWQNLNTAIGNSPLLDLNFVTPLLDNFSNGSEKLAIYGDLDDPEIMALIRPEKKGIWTTFQSSNAPLGLWLSKNTDLNIPCIKSLIKLLPGFVAALGLTQQDPLFLSRPSEQTAVNSLDYIETAHIVFPDNFEDYWAKRSKNLRHNMKRQRNFLSKNHIETRLEICHDKAQIKQAVLDYGKIESSGWKGQIDSAVTGDDAQSLFYIHMLEAFCASGEGLILRYYYNGELVATDLCLLRDKTLYILKTTYDETIKGTSPAHIMRFEYYQAAVASGALKHVEFYGPLKDWHTKWTNETRIIFHTNIYRNSCIAQVHKIVKLIG